MTHQSELIIEADDPRMPPAKRIALWTDAMKLSGRVENMDENGFYGRMTVHRSNYCITMRIAATKFSLKRTNQEAVPLGEGHIALNLVLEGTIKGLIGGRRFTANSRSVIVSRMDSVIDVVLDGATWLSLIIPYSVFTPTLKWDSRYDGMLLEAGSLNACGVGALIQHMEGVGSAATLQQLTLLLMSVAPLINAQPAQSPSPISSAVSYAERSRNVRRYIMENIRSRDLSIANIQAALGLSRSAIYRCLGNKADLASYIRQMRLDGLYRELAAGLHRDASLGQIADMWGWSNERVLRRAFVEVFGCTPSQLRARSTGTPTQSPSGVLERWFAGL